VATKSKTSKRYKKSTKAQKRKTHSTVLTILLVLMALHGIFATIVYYTVNNDGSALSRPWVATLMVVHSLANVAAAAGIWYWKKWALYLYAASTVLALVVGLISVGIWSVFYVVLPLAIVGWVLKDHWDYFE
jgi:hypothetical protein